MNWFTSNLPAFGHGIAIVLCAVPAAYLYLIVREGYRRAARRVALAQIAHMVPETTRCQHCEKPIGHSPAMDLPAGLSLQIVNGETTAFLVEHTVCMSCYLLGVAA